MSYLDQLEIEVLEQAIESYQSMLLTLRKMSRNQRNDSDIREQTKEVMDATRGKIQQLIDKRDQAKAAICAVRNQVPASVTQTTAETLHTGRLV